MSEANAPSEIGAERGERYQLLHMARIAPVPCPCGQSRRAFIDDVDQAASFHIVEIKADSERHYHRKLTEIYHVLEGTGTMELDGAVFPIEPGTTVLIKPGCRHRAVGKLKIAVVAIPAFDPTDEWLD